jgi:hypothetical protein
MMALLALLLTMLLRGEQPATSLTRPIPALD